VTAARAIRAWLASADVPSNLPRWSPTWAGDVAADAERLREAGVGAEEAWLRAADLHRPAGAPTPLRRSNEAPLCDTAERILLFLLESPEPVTVRQICEALGLQKQIVSPHLRRVGRQVGARSTERRNSAATWRAR
jgi:DNA-binding transcriptional ArsR family regulator